MARNNTSIIRRPIVTEKTTRLATAGQYVFEVAVDANSIDVARVVAQMYHVHPTRVRMMNVRGRNVRFGSTNGRQRHWKKAIVALRAGEKIETFSKV